MKTMLLWLALVSAATAQCRTYNYNSQLAITPYAIPVAVPVATVTTNALYSYKEAAPANTGQLDAETVAALKELVKSHRPRQAPAAGLVSQRCAGCHTGGGQAVSHFDLNNATGEDLRNAIKAVANGSMPKGNKMSGDEIGKIVYELSIAPPTTGTQEPPPKPPVTYAPKPSAVDVEISEEEYQRYMEWKKSAPPIVKVPRADYEKWKKGGEKQDEGDSKPSSPPPQPSADGGYG